LYYSIDYFSASLCIQSGARDGPVENVTLHMKNERNSGVIKRI